jgi:Pyruvate/2-oxoacid:ferredoxin oxidoreductase gamma subunit
VHAWGDQPGGDAGDLSTTICKSGWTATIRPSTSVTNKIKTEAIAAYGDYAGAAPGNYELDHLISLELGGAPDAIANLWPEKGLHNAKDPVENAAKRAVCAHTMTLADAQHAIATNWIALGHRLGVTGIPAS